MSSEADTSGPGTLELLRRSRAALPGDSDLHASLQWIQAVLGTPSIFTIVDGKARYDGPTIEQARERLRDILPMLELALPNDPLITWLRASAVPSG